MKDENLDQSTRNEQPGDNTDQTPCFPMATSKPPYERLEELNKEQHLAPGVRVSWKTKTTPSGIQISGGPTTIDHKGTVVGVIPVMDPQSNQQAIGLVVASDDKEWTIIPMHHTQII